MIQKGLGRVERFHMQLRPSCFRVMGPGGACSNVDAVSIISFRSEDMSE